MPPSIFWSIIGNDVPGPNEAPEKAELIRTFLIPNEYTVEHSSPNHPRTIKIFAAFVSESWVWVLSDFSGLVRMNVRSRNIPYTPEDFQIGSRVCNLILNIFYLMLLPVISQNV